jgi:cobalt-zinc-cadmium efflux system protein
MHQHHYHPHLHDDPAERLPTRQMNRSRLAWTLGLTLAYMLAEVIGGFLSDSLALLADAGHMLSDAASLGLSLFAVWIAARRPNPKHTYGYYRAEILAALANGAALVGIALYIFGAAVSRFGAPHVVEGPLMMWVAFGGLVINLLCMAILHSGRAESLNMHGAWLHLLTDALGSVAALIAGGLIWAYGWNWADPAASILISLLVVYSSWGLLKEAIAILMESTPAHIDIDAVLAMLSSTEGVCEIHDLHLWTITSGMDSLSAHIVVANGYASHDILTAIQRSLHEHFGIDHVTIQIDPLDQTECPSAF